MTRTLSLRQACGTGNCQIIFLLLCTQVEDVAQGTAPTLQLVSRSQANVGLQQQNTGALQHQGSEDDIGAGRLTGGSVLVLGQKVQTRSLTQNQGAGAYGFARSEYKGILTMLQNGKGKLIAGDK